MKNQRYAFVLAASGCLLVLGNACGAPGVLREIWTNVAGDKTTALESFEAYPTAPVATDIIESLQTETNKLDYYGQRLRALLKPTESGEYTFWIAGDNSADLWLSTDATPGNATRIARATSATSSEQWNKNEAQKSETISLVAGNSYYIEALHKEHNGGDNLAVAWARGSGSPAVISSAYLSAWEGAETSKVPGLRVEAGRSIELYQPALATNLDGQVLDLTGVRGSYSTNWSVISGSRVVLEDPDKLATRAEFQTPGTYELLLTITKGDFTETDSLTVTVHPKLDPEAGKATQQFWFGTGGTELNKLTGNLDFPKYPHMTREVDALDGPVNFFSYYGTRTVGYLLAPRTGSYRFYLSGDDSARFSLSTDATPSNARSIAEVTSSTSRWDFFVDPDNQISDAITLVRGRRYYFELLHKEHGGSDHHSVFWGREGSDVIELIEGEFLAPIVAADAEVPTLDIDSDYVVHAGRDQTIYLPNRNAKMDAYAGKRRWNTKLLSQTWSGPAGVVFADPTDLKTPVTFPGAGTYTLSLKVISDEQTVVDRVRIQVRGAVAAATGSLTREVWFNRRYKTLEEFRTDQDYPSNPNITDSLTALSGPVNWSTNYGTRVTGWLHIPQTGDYTFYLAADEEAEFSISSVAGDSNALELASRAPSPTGSKSWFKFPEQKSRVYRLNSGQRYFVELVHRESYSSDYFNVAWTLGEDREPSIIDGSFFQPAKAAPEYREEITFYAYAGSDREYYWPHNEASLAGSTQRVRSSEAETSSLWAQVSGPPSEIADASQLDTKVSFSNAGRYEFKLMVSAEGISHSDNVVFDIHPQLAEDTGSLLRSVWLDIDGYYISDLLDHDPELAYPDFEDLLPGTVTPIAWADLYGTRLAGTLVVPKAGAYTFFTAANDSAELWLGTSASKEGAQKISFVSSSVSPGQWTRREGQESSPITLQAGRYYLEARHKERYGHDHMAIAWDGPATNGRELISKGFLSPLRDAVPHNSEIQVILGQDRVLLWPDNTIRLAGLVYDLEEGPSAITYLWSQEPSANPATFSDSSHTGTDITFSKPGIYELSLTAQDGVHYGGDSIIVTVQDPLAPSTGGLLREYYSEISGSRIQDLERASSFPDAPTFRDTVTSFEAPTDIGDNYGTRLRGYLRVPETDDYTFYIAGDDALELRMNPNGDDPSRKQKIAYSTRATGRYQWTRSEKQKSETFRLQSGVSYYIEALHKEGSGRDSLGVAWQRGSDENAPIQLIPGPMLAPFEDAAVIDEAIAITVGGNISLHWPFEMIEVKGTALDMKPGPLPLTVSWDVTRGASGVEIRSPNELRSEVRFPGPGKYTLQLTATDGQTSRSDSLVVRILKPLALDTGSLLCEIFTGISGYRVTDMLNAESYPAAPSARTQLKSLEIPQNVDEAFGARLRGYLHPHKSGFHRFNISGNDWAELYLSIDDDPENKELVCFTPQAVAVYDWLKFPEYQVSRPILLKKGRKYYLEARLKDHSSSDHLAVAWKIPRADHYEIVAGANLSPLVLADSTAPEISLQGAEEIVLIVDSEFTDPGITAIDDIDGSLNETVVSEHNIDTSTPGNYTVRYSVVDSAGNESDEIVRHVRVVLAEEIVATYPPDTSGNHPGGTWSGSAAGGLTDLEASRFLLQASFGPTEEALAEVKRLGISRWIDQQLAMPASGHLEELDRYARFAGARRDTTSGIYMEASTGESDLPMAKVSAQDRIHVWWTHAIKSPDQLRQRVAFALSQILVVSDRGSELARYPRGTTNYYDLLVDNAFGNYRDLLEEVSLNPMMGVWLTHIRSSKESPDENYPRELMQLFSTGLHHLNQDGTNKTAVDGSPLVAYGQDEILNVSRALTGWSYSGSRSFYYTSTTGVDSISPLIPFEGEHDRGAKTLLGGKVLPAGQTAEQDLQGVVDNIFGHPNVGPFIARRLIQHLVTSNPSPAYIYRVAGVFNDNGRSIRGDLKAVVKAILLDPEARILSDSTTAGKVKEPILRLTNLLRACYQEPSNNPPTLGRFVLEDETNTYGQSPLGAETVFNFFQPDFSLPGPLAEAGLYAPEFQIVTELNAVEVANHLFDGIRQGFPVYFTQVQRIGVDLSDLEARSNNIDAMINHAEKLFLGRAFSSETRKELKNAAAAYPDDPEAIARTVIQVIVASPEFAIQK